MATKPLIPENEQHQVLEMWSEGKSTREIAEALKSRGLEVGHATVWRLIQRVSMKNGDFGMGVAVQRLREQVEEDVEKLMDIEDRIIRASHPGAEKLDFQYTMQGLKLLVAGHRLLLSRLKAMGLFGKLGDKLHRDVSHIWSEEEGGEGPFDEPVARPAANDEPPGLAPHNRDLFHVKQEKSLESSETRRNSPPAVSPPATTGQAEPTPVSPSRTRQCPCKSGKKYKHCCGKDSREAAKRAA